MVSQNIISMNDLGEKGCPIKLIDNVEGKALLTHFLQDFKYGHKRYTDKQVITKFTKLIEYNCEEENRNLNVEELLQGFLFEFGEVPFPAPKSVKFEFIDLFAGIGGFRLAGSEDIFNTSNENIDLYLKNFTPSIFN